MQSNTPAPTPWWPFITISILLIVIVALGLGMYTSYAHNVELARGSADMQTQLQTNAADKTVLTQQVNSLTKQVAQLSCDGVWTGETCTAYPAFITNKVSSGASPLAVTFSIKAKNAKYAVDFGDGSTTPIVTGANGSGACVPKDDGFCLFNVSHTYRATSEMHFDVRLLKDTTVAATTSVSIVAKK